MPEDSPKQQPPVSGKGRRGKRLLGVLAAGAILLAGAYGYLHFTYTRAVGSGPAGPALGPEADYANPWTHRPVLLVGMGDSITAGFGARKGYAYFDRLLKAPQDEFEEVKHANLARVFPGLQSTNLAVSGSTSFECLELQLPHLKLQDTQTLGVIVITTGGNDLIHNYGRTPPRQQAMYGAAWEQAQPWIEGYKQRLESILTGASSRFPGGCHIFLANIYDPTDGVGDIEKAGLPKWPDGARVLAAYNQAISECADRHPNVHLVDLYGLFLGHGIHCGQFWAKHYDRRDPHYWYFTNLEDPNERGYDAIRRAFLLEMSKVLKAR